MRAYNNRIVHHNAPALKAWRTEIAAHAQKAMQRYNYPADYPFKVMLRFELQKPQRPTRDFPIRPDLDKLVRAVLDALTGVVWVDDSQVTQIVASKVFGSPGVLIEVERTDV